jgi:hypothetical protein
MTNETKTNRPAHGNFIEEALAGTYTENKIVELLKISTRGNKRPEWAIRLLATKTGKGFDYPVPTKKRASVLYAALVAEGGAA